MVPIDRREFVAASGLVAIAGCLARGNEEDDDSSGDDALPESLAAVLDPVRPRSGTWSSGSSTSSHRIPSARMSR